MVGFIFLLKNREPESEGNPNWGYLFSFSDLGGNLINR